MMISKAKLALAGIGMRVCAEMKKSCELAR
jgi:hypothetical protein